MWNGSTPLVLGSGSPRRREMLERLGMALFVDAPSVDESQKPGQSSTEYVTAVTFDKLTATVEKWRDTEQAYSGVLCADTVVCLDGDILQKPGDEDEGASMLSRLSGRTHQVMTAYALWVRSTERVVQRTVTTAVTFRSISRSEVVGYVRTGEGRDKAGGYAVQGLASVFVQQIEGSYSNVVGLPLCELWLDFLSERIIDEAP